MSLPEVLLWERLRGAQCGIRFRRQHPMGGYILDFYCPAARLAIEVDGEAHNCGDRPARDGIRDRFLTNRGLRILHVPAADILRDPDTAAAAIVEAARPLHHPAMPGGPPPHAPHGEDLQGTGP